MDLKSNTNYLFIDSKEKLVYSLTKTVLEHIDTSIKNMFNYYRTHSVPHLPMGTNRIVYSSADIGEIDALDYMRGNRYLTVVDTPASRILYGTPVNIFIS